MPDARGGAETSLSVGLLASEAASSFPGQTRPYRSAIRNIAGFPPVTPASCRLSRGVLALSGAWVFQSALIRSTPVGRQRHSGQDAGDTLFAALLQQFGDEAGPAGLMACSEAATVVAVKVFVEQNMIAKMRVGLKLLGLAEDRPPAVVVFQEDARQPPRQFLGDLPEVHHLARAGRAFDLEDRRRNSGETSAAIRSAGN